MVNYLVMAYLDVFKPEVLNSEAESTGRLPLTAIDNTQD